MQDTISLCVWFPNLFLRNLNEHSHSCLWYDLCTCDLLFSLHRSLIEAGILFYFVFLFSETEFSGQFCIFF